MLKKILNMFKLPLYRIAMHYNDHEIVFTNNWRGFESVYLDGDLVSEKGNLLSTKSSHYILINQEDYEVRIWVTSTMNVSLYRVDVSLYKGFSKVASFTPDKRQKMGWLGFCFLAGLFVGGLVSGYIFGRFVFAAI